MFGDSDVDEFDSDFEEIEFAEELALAVPAVDPKGLVERQIQEAAVNGWLEELDQLLTKNEHNITVDSPLDGGWTALMYAASASQSEIVEYLLMNNANVNATVDTISVLMCACSGETINEASNLSCVKQILLKGARINVLDKYKQTPLMRAMERGKDSVCFMLMSRANLEIKDMNGRTAIFYAVQHNRIRVMEEMIKLKASLDVVDKQGITIRDIAVTKNYAPMLNVLQEYLDDVNRPTIESEFTFEGICDWREMFPGIFNSHKPAYWHEVPHLLYGMNCEKLIRRFQSAEVDLYRALTLTENDIDDIGVTLPYLKKRLKYGLYRFHTHKWNINTVLGYSSKFDRNTDFKICLDYVASHMKHMTALKATFAYLKQNIKADRMVLPKESEATIDKLIDHIARTKYEIKDLREVVEKVNKSKLPPADLICPHQGRPTSLMKYIFYFSALTAIGVASTIKIRQFVN